VIRRSFSQVRQNPIITSRFSLHLTPHSSLFPLFLLLRSSPHSHLSSSLSSFFFTISLSLLDEFLSFLSSDDNIGSPRSSQDSFKIAVLERESSDRLDLLKSIHRRLGALQVSLNHFSSSSSSSSCLPFLSFPPFFLSPYSTRSSVSSCSSLFCCYCYCCSFLLWLPLFSIMSPCFVLVLVLVLLLSGFWESKVGNGSLTRRTSETLRSTLYCDGIIFAFSFYHCFCFSFIKLSIW
jgi:hypothetical protein